MDESTIASRPWLARLQRVLTPTWQTRHRDGAVVHSGYYCATRRRNLLPLLVPGRIIERDGRVTDVYLGHPPAWLRVHPKYPCLQLLAPGSNWFRMHWNKSPILVDTARAFMEQMLREAAEIRENHTG